MKIDSLVMHSDDIGESVGEFFGSPIREVNLLDVEVREELDMQARARLGLGVEAVPAELLPGEVITDNVIRRSTTAEVVGDTFYQPQTTEQGAVNLMEVDYWDNFYSSLEKEQCREGENVLVKVSTVLSKDLAQEKELGKDAPWTEKLLSYVKTLLGVLNIQHEAWKTRCA